MPHPYVTKTLLYCLIGIFALQVILSPIPTTGILNIHSFVLLGQGALSKKAVWEMGEHFRLLTAVFLHVNVIHVIFNCIGLWYAAHILERLIGHVWFLALFFLGGIGGSLCSLYMHDGNIVSAGASGAIMALFASLLMILKVLPLHIPLRDDGRADALKILVFSLIPLSYDGLGLNIDIWGHLGGAITGGLVGFLLYETWNKQKNQPRFKAVACLIILASLLGLGSGVRHLQQNYGAFSTLVQQEYQSSQRVVHDADPQTSWLEIPEDTISPAQRR
jgi:membrane associated rhomboid family serine protease